MLEAYYMFDLEDFKNSHQIILKIKKTKCMKTVKSKMSFLTLGIVSLALFGVISCSKSSSGGGSTTPPVTLLGGFASSDSVEPAALIAYWPFDGNSTEKVAGLVGTSTGVTYVTGLRGMAYQGSVGGSLQVPI